MSWEPDPRRHYDAREHEHRDVFVLVFAGPDHLRHNADCLACFPYDDEHDDYDADDNDEYDDKHYDDTDNDEHDNYDVELIVEE